MLRADNQKGVDWKVLQFGQEYPFQSQPDRPRDLFGLTRFLINNMDGPARHGKDSDDRILFLESAFNVKGRPGRAFFIFREAHCIFHRVAKGRTLDAAGLSAAHIANDEPQGTADRRVGAVAGPERPQALIHADPVTDRTIDNNHWRRPHRGGSNAMNIECIGADSLQCGNNHRHVFRLASRHDRVDGNFFYRRFTHIGRDGGNKVLRRAARAVQHSQDPFRRRRHERQTIGKTLIKHELNHVVRRRNIDAPRPDRTALCACAQLVVNFRIKMSGAASGAPCRQA